MPIAFALVESENSKSWLRFLKLIKRALVEDRENACVLHDRNAGLLNAVEKLKNGRGPEVQRPDIQSRWCMRHLGSNFYKQFKRKRLMDLFKRLCKQNQRKKFDFLWQRLDELTTSHMNEVRRQPIVALEEEPQGLSPDPYEAKSKTR